MLRTSAVQRYGVQTPRITKTQNTPQDKVPMGRHTHTHTAGLRMRAKCLWCHGMMIWTSYSTSEHTGQLTLYANRDRSQSDTLTLG